MGIPVIMNTQYESGKVVCVWGGGVGYSRRTTGILAIRDVKTSYICKIEKS